MGIISVSLPSDGQTADAADYNTPVNTIVNEINGKLDNANIASGAAISGSKLADTSITNAKLATGAGEPGGTWTSWTPSWTNFTTGNGTLDYAKYTRVGKTVHFRLKFTLGTTSAVSGSIEFTLPVDLTADYSSQNNEPIDSVVTLRDTGTALTRGFLARGASDSVVAIRVETASGTYVQATSTSSTVPHTWANTDEIYCVGTYEGV